MPNKPAAKKALRQSIKKSAKNENTKANIKFLSRMTRKSLENNKLEEAKDFAKKAVKQIDKATKNNILKKNTGARKKSVIMRSLNKK